MYGDPTKLPPVGRRPKRPKDQSRTRLGTPVALSRSLNQNLQQGLYSGLFQGFTTPAKAGAGHRASLQSPLPGTVETPGPEKPLSGITIRKVGLLSGESVSHTFCPEEGLVATPPEAGRMLLLTNQRVIAFGQSDGMRQTVLMPLEEVKAVAVNVGHRSKGTLFQGGLMVVAAVFFYVLLAYWLTGRIDGPTVPIIRMDLVAFVVFLAVLTGVALLAQVYFAKPDGEVTFQGDGVKLTFPFRGETAEDEIYQVVNAAFAARQTVVGESRLQYPGLGPDQLPQNR
ncbi:MAG: hypothetical protein IH872_06740 [Chloroflexi bacterium]|nr:hypothetical protein [Chloroflexota bacterium]